MINENKGESVPNEKLKEQISRLEMQLDRERRGRKQAEEMLRSQAIELASSARFLTNMSERLQLAFMSENEIMWEYIVQEDAFYQFADVNDKRANIQASGTFEEAVNLYHKEDQMLSREMWKSLIEGENLSFNFVARRYSLTHKTFRWMQIRGQKVVDEKTQTVKKIVGMFKDIHEQHKKDISFNTLHQAFVHSDMPSFIVDFAEPHVEVSDSFFKMIDATTSSVNTKSLLDLMPLAQIQQALSEQQQGFTAQIVLGDAAQVAVAFKLIPLKQEKHNDEYYRYAVGFVKRLD